MPRSNNEKKSRRTVLQTVAAGSTALGLATLSGAAAADADDGLDDRKWTTDDAHTRGLRSRYGTPERVRGLFVDEADSVVEALHQAGLLPESNVEVFDFESALRGGDGPASIEFSTLYSPDGDRPVGKVRLRRETDSHLVSIFVEPDNDHAYGLALGKEERENRLAVQGRGMVSTQDSCTCNNYCTVGEPCNANCCDEDTATYNEEKTVVCEGRFNDDGNCVCDCDKVCNGNSNYDSDCLCDATFTCSCNCGA